MFDRSVTPVTSTFNGSTRVTRPPGSGGSVRAGVYIARHRPAEPNILPNNPAMNAPSLVVTLEETASVTIVP